MRLISELFGRSPFGPLVEHTRKVHECVKLVRPVMEAVIGQDYEEVHRLQDSISKLEYDADRIKQAIREHLPRRMFLPVDRDDLNAFLHCQDSVADAVEDFAVVCVIRKTKVHPALGDEFTAFVDQVASLSEGMLAVAEEMIDLAETSFAGAEADTVLQRIAALGEEEWKADRMQRKLSIRIYALEGELDPITILFYEKMLRTLSAVANEADKTGELLRAMIVKG